MKPAPPDTTTRFPHDDGGSTPFAKGRRKLLRGRARFVDDVHLDRMVHGAFVRSPMPHADIVSIDPSRALAAGALAVLTARDLPFNDQPWIVRYWHPSIRNGLPKFLATGRVRFVGEPVAFVVARRSLSGRGLGRTRRRRVPVPACLSLPSATRPLGTRRLFTPNGPATSLRHSNIITATRRAHSRTAPIAPGANSISFGKPLSHWRPEAWLRTSTRHGHLLTRVAVDAAAL